MREGANEGNEQKKKKKKKKKKKAQVFFVDLSI